MFPLFTQPKSTFLSLSPHTGWPQARVVASSIPLRSQPVLLCGLPGSGHLGTAAAGTFCSSPCTFLDNGLVFSLAPWVEDPSYSAQASHQVCYLGPSTETGRWLTTGSYLTTITSSSPPPRYFIQLTVSRSHPREVWDCGEKMWISCKSSPPYPSYVVWKNEMVPSAKIFFHLAWGEKQNNPNKKRKNKKPRPNIWERFYENLVWTQVDAPPAKKENNSTVYWTENWVNWWCSV